MSIRDPQFTIREVTEDDCPAICALMRANADAVLAPVYSALQLGVWKEYNSEDRLRERMSGRSQFCAHDGDGILGTAGLAGNELVGLYVSSNHLGLGVGGALLAYVEAIASARGIDRLHLNSTPVAVGFYLRRGWIEAGPVEIRIMGVSFEDTRMEKVLAAGPG